MSFNNLIVRRSCVLDENFTPIKIEYHDPLDSTRIVSQTYLQSPSQPPPKLRKISCNVISGIPQIALKREKSRNYSADEVVLVNGCWDTTNRIPNIVAEMHVNTEDFSPLQNVAVFKYPELDSQDLINGSPRSSDSGIESDCTDGNLSWLLNYKINELPPVPDASNGDNAVSASHGFGFKPLMQPRLVQVEVPTLPTKNLPQKEDGKGTGQSYRYSGPKKPPFTYTELIEYALCEKGELTVSGIYQWISDHFPFYKQNDDRWKNSVRHNLSINPHFRKGGKAIQGAGHLWTIAQRDDRKSLQIKQRMAQFIQNSKRDAKTREQEAFDRELKAATESILGEMNQINNNALENENIEVEYINLEGPSGLEDFLTPPVSKQEIVNECGLGSDFFITDINPTALGLNLGDHDSITEDNIYDNVFEYYELKE